MIDIPILPVLSELGLQPTEILVLTLLWQNIKKTNILMGRIVRKVNELDEKIKTLSN
ncbi:hypothetical protein [Vibrio methylphosphonaticus]|uniref:hypothetical protein n=1 Tax=Vibrio methylphosphonaticus TaxID=2946866 RepID=UPI002029C46A|nr:hypothetical protein [Vibrio methylphosphonaticus]MCL9777049.1 hypothetical protein [Vibrio methylphosphonaticus]